MLSDSKISTLESGFKNFRICLRIRRMRVDDSRIQKEKIAGKKYPDTCGRGLRQRVPKNAASRLVSSIPESAEKIKRLAV